MIPQSVTSICLKSLKGEYDDQEEQIYGLKLAKIILTSKEHAQDFV